MAGVKTVYEGYLNMNSVDIAGVPIVSAGDIFGAESDDVFTAFKGGVYKRIVVSGGLVRGVLFVGEIRQAGVLVNQIIRAAKLEDAAALVKNISFADLLAI